MSIYILTKGQGVLMNFFKQILINFSFALNPQNPLTLCEYIYTHKGSGGFDWFSGVRGTRYCYEQKNVAQGVILLLQPKKLGVRG